MMHTELGMLVGRQSLALGEGGGFLDACSTATLQGLGGYQMRAGIRRAGAGLVPGL